MKKILLLIVTCFILTGCSAAYWDQVAANMRRQQQYQPQYQQPTNNNQYNDNWNYEQDMRFRQQMAEKAKASQNNACNSFSKPIPKPGCEITRCYNGQWEQVCSQDLSGMDCGFKPSPPLGCYIGRCVSGQWEIICN